MNTVTYCMNVHPGEDIVSVRQALEDVSIPLRSALGLETSFPLGLRLGERAAKELRVPEVLRRFCSFLQRNHLTVMGINGFPYGPFHGAPVKTSVYEPDWADTRRVSYSRDLFYALSRFPTTEMGEGHCPNITTVPLSYNCGQTDLTRYMENLCAMALFLRKLEGFTGKHLRLALEPEPDCLLESSQRTIDFFEALWSHPDWNPLFHDYIGLCFDSCHFALAYEDPLDALQRFVTSNVPVARIQVSAALETNAYTRTDDLFPFLDDTYLHQTRRRRDDATLDCFPDLTPDVIQEMVGQRGRIHYHLPLAWDGSGHLESTRHTLTPAFWRYVRAGGWPVEVEAYTYSVYPDWLRTKTLSEVLLADIRWTQEQLQKV
ncbi:MAG: metabolite traffic protein EboE [Kiritimatiellia bacterium]